jgi:hypothetical protein
LTTFVEVPLPAGGSLIVESSSAPETGVVRAGRARDVAAMAAETFESAIDRLKSAADAVVSKMDTLAKRPNEVTVQFAVKLGTEIGVVIANTSAEANLTLQVKWTRD